MQDLTQLTDPQLEEHRVALLAELDRRNKLHDIPNDIKRLAQDFAQLGGDNAKLVTAVQDLETPSSNENPTLE
ncbi:hypothetical protein E3O62_02490 [Cryobacterium sp. TMT2-15-1]|uniref:hypothetical protein n=1 Tax=Cryobacterium sp. TMT2-15-1 TaxID=1259246 RepID=UPI00106A0031|nr:hypothetical protein [Cryobacterium sp. TMT2-15-1]TFC63715.1 hypothetical protein E3O62_02490 [Cryobacterium sp. TMT2-15-1]